MWISNHFHTKSLRLLRLGRIMSGMHRRKRPFTRGNSLMFGILLIALLGSSAVLLESVDSVNPQSQMAQAPDPGRWGKTKTAPTSTTKPADEKKKKVAIDPYCGGDAKGTEKSDVQCKPGCEYTVDPVVQEGTGTSATKSEDKQVKSEVTMSSKNVEECNLPANAAKPGMCADKKCKVCFQRYEKGELKPPVCKLAGPEDFKKIVKDQTKEGYQAKIDEMLKRLNDPASDSKDSRLATDVANDLKNAQAIRENADAQEIKELARKDYDAALKEYIECTRSGTPEDCGTAKLDAAEAAAKKATEDAALTQANLDKLKKEQASLYANCKPGTEGCSNLAPPAKPGDMDCAKPENKEKPGCKTTTFDDRGGGGGGGSGSGGCQGGNCGGGGGSGSNPLQSLLGPLANLLGQYLNQPSCVIKAQPASIPMPSQQNQNQQVNPQTGQPQGSQAVTLSWTSQNAYTANLSNSGQVQPNGSMQVYPTQTTTYTLQVMGMQQNNNMFGSMFGQQQQQQQQQGQYIWNPQLGAYVYMQSPQGYGSPGQQQGTPTYASCNVQVKVGDQGSGDVKAKISCQPLVADPGMSVAISYSCLNAATSKGEGFSTDNSLSGSAVAKIDTPTIGQTSQTFGLTCSNQGKTDSAQCSVKINKSAIVMVANPKNVPSGETINIGWVTSGMNSCVLSSPTLNKTWEPSDAQDKQTSGVVKTPGITQDTEFKLECTTIAGQTKSATVTVKIGEAVTSWVTEEFALRF